MAAREISKAWKGGIRDLILVHGAGSFGHPLVVKYGLRGRITSAEQKLGVSITHESCGVLSSAFVWALHKQKVPAIAIPPAMMIVQKNQRICSFGKIVHELLGSEYLPVLYGDVVPDQELGFSVCSGDQLVSYLGKQADSIALGTNVDGVLDSEGKIINSITKKNFADVLRHLKPVAGDVTGGMEGKLWELLDMKTHAHIFNATVPGRIEDILKGEKTISTKVSAD